MSARHLILVLVACCLACGLPDLSLAQSSTCCPGDGHNFTTNASAQGLGTAQPNAIDVSQQPGWHVYLFVRDGIRYVQVNDNFGNTRMAVGQVGTTLFTLPIGRDAVSVVPAVTGGIVVYKDASITVTGQTAANGVVMWQAAPSNASSQTSL